MKVLINFQIIPIGVGVSLSKYVAECERILSDADVTYQLHANGTNVEGEWDTVFAVVKKCHETLHEMGAPRIQTVISAGTRNDREQSMQDKIDSVARQLKG